LIVVTDLLNSNVFRSTQHISSCSVFFSDFIIHEYHIFYKPNTIKQINLNQLKVQFKQPATHTLDCLQCQKIGFYMNIVQLTSRSKQTGFYIWILLLSTADMW